MAYVLNCGVASNLSLVGIDTAIPANVSLVELPLAACTTLGYVLNNGTNVYAAMFNRIFEVDTATNSVARTYILAGATYLDGLTLDPANSSQMFVLDVGVAVWTLDLVTGTATKLIDSEL